MPRSNAGSRSSAEPGPRSGAKSEPESQFTLKMRRSLHRELARLAFEAEMTMRGFIMKALKDKGLKVTQADLVDRRRREDE